MSLAAPPHPGLRAMEEARPAHARWAALNGAFLDHAARHPEYLERATFASLDEPWLRAVTLQPWPFFVDAAGRAELERIALGMDRLMKGTLARFLAGGGARVRGFFRFGPEERTPRRAILGTEGVLEMLLAEPSGLAGARSRGDYLQTADGLRCVEYNGGALGISQLRGIGEAYLRCPAVARFLEAQGARAHAPDTFAASFRHLVAETVALGAWDGGEFNAAVVVWPNDAAWGAMYVEAAFDDALGRVLAERGMPGGRALVCGVDDLREEGGRVFVGDRPVHLVMEHHEGPPLRTVFRAFKDRRVNLVSGPVGRILSDKGNMALISEHADSDDYTAAERAFIERHVPWTRRLLPMRTTFRGRGIRLPDDLPGRREAFVLKKSCSVGGSDVLVGRYRTDADWRGDLARAAREEDWIVQEHLETVPCCFQAGERGAAIHDLVWGLFAFGEHFGGAMLRMQPRGGTGVVNATQGARVGVCLELEG